MKRMMLVGMVAMGLAARGAAAQGVDRKLDREEEAQVQAVQAQLQAQAVDGQVKLVQAQAKNAQAQVTKAQTLIKIAEDQAKRMEPGTYLGIASSPVPAALREQLKLKRGVGLVVERVEKDSPAEQAGVKQYDIIEKMDDQLLVNPDQFAALVRMQETGAQVKLAIIRQGQPQTVTATLVQKEVPVKVGWLDGGLFDGKVMIDSAPTFTIPGNGKGAWNLAQNRDMTVVSSVRDNVLTLRRDGDNMHLVAKDQAGTVIFDGDINNDEEWNKVPLDIAAEARRLIARMNIPPVRPVAPAAPKMQVAPAAPQPAQPDLP